MGSSEGTAVGSSDGVIVGRRVGSEDGCSVGAHVLLMEPLLPSNMLQVDVTWLMSQQRVWEKDEAPLNIYSMSVTLLTSQADTSLLKDVAP